MEELIDYLYGFYYNDKDINNILLQFTVQELSDEEKYVLCKNLNEYLLSYGFKKKEIVSIFRNFHKLYTYSAKDVADVFKGLENLGYLPKEVIKIIKISISINGLNTKIIKQKISDMMSLGFSFNQVKKMTLDSKVVFARNILPKKEDSEESNLEDIENKDKKMSIKEEIDGLEKLGYSRENIIKIMVASSKIFYYDSETIKQKIQDIKDLGYSDEEVLKMTSIFPSLLIYGIDYIRQKIIDLIELGFTKEEVYFMTIETPALFGYSIDNIRDKVKNLTRLHLGNIITKEPGRLITSSKLVFARYQFLTANNYDVSEGNHGKLFYQEKVFKKLFGKSNVELLALYPYVDVDRKLA